MMRNEMMIGAWVEPSATRKAYRLAKEMGLTHLFIGDSVFGIERGTAAFAKLLRLCESTGLRAIIRNMNQYPFQDPTDYALYPAVEGINYWDEPFDTDFEKVADLAEEHERKFCNRLFCFNNLNPNEIAEGWHPWSAEKDYEQYIEEYCKKVLSKVQYGEKWLSCDIYPLILSGDKVIVKETWLPGVECIAKYAKKYNAESHFFVQTSSWLHYPPMTEAGLRYQFSVEMAYGIRHYSYFTYADYDDGTEHSAKFKGLVDGKEEPRPQYAFAKSINAELKSIQADYLSWDWQGVLPIAGETTQKLFGSLKNSISDLSGLTQVKSSRDLLVGSFLSAEKENIYALANFHNPFEPGENRIALTIPNRLSVRVFSRGEWAEHPLEKETLQLTLAPGEGVFVQLNENGRK